MLAVVSAESRVVTKLLSGGRLALADLEASRLQSELCGLPLLEVLVAEGKLLEEELAQVLADLYKLRYLDLARRSVSEPWVLAVPENLCRSKRFLPIGEVEGHLVVAVADPGDRTIVNELNAHLKKPIQLVVGRPKQIDATLGRIFTRARAKGAQSLGVSTLTTGPQVTNISGMNMVEVVDSIIDEAVDRRASDIHLETEEDRVRVRIRIDGRMVETRAYPQEVSPALISRVKIMAKLDITERRRPQDGRFSHKSFDQDIDVRVATIPTVDGERVTMRLLGLDRGRLEFEQLGMDLELEQAVKRIITQPHGIILITGPTGSGKTTTLYTALQEIHTVDKHIITIEDPVEYHIPGINQVQVDHENGVTFSGALRSIVRHDPDVIMVGEIRDRETASLAIDAALTGHLVFATLHTNSAVGSITRLLDMGCEPFLLSSAVIALMAQRLVRRICERCKQPYLASEPERALLDVPPERKEVELYRGRGCSRCLRSGYYDRVGIYEFVPFDKRFGEMVMRRAATSELHEYALSHGARSLRMDAMVKVLNGLTTLEEALRVTAADTE
jgi:type II secretory ATPase GspE/PulE/Tfp pilus assembly ATPase PilB-like protein